MPPARAAVAALALVALCAGFVAFGPIRVENDFLAIYCATAGVLHGVSPYDLPGLTELFATTLRGDIPIREAPPFPYLPWYVLAALPLGALDLGAAGRLFLLANTAGILATVALVLPGPPDPRRFLLGALAAMYVPVLGLLAVGQYVVPVLLGAALALRAVDRRDPNLFALAALLLSFKWHLGAFPGLAALILAARDRDLLRAAVPRTVALFAAAAAAGLLVDPRWPTAYPAAVREMMAMDVNVTCDTCSSVTASVTRATGAPGNAVFAAVAALGWTALLARGLHRHPHAMLSGAICVGLAALPYVRSYDFALFAIPLLLRADRTDTPAGRALLLVLWAAPAVLLGLPRDVAAAVLGTTAVAMLAWTLRDP